ncbi:MAG: DUF2889 domain-containing protein [bacterium]|nr:DUF2889 domain-containing protein [bacterium]
MSELADSFPHLADLPSTLDDTVVGTPDRRPGSVRRTSTIDMVWPDGFGSPMHLVGRSRDLSTPVDGPACVIDEAGMRVEMAEHRTVSAIEVSPHRDGADGLIGAVGGSELRSAIDRALPRERETASPLHLLLDDIAGTSLVASFALSRSPEIRELMLANRPGPGAPFGMRKGKIICSGLRPDGWFDTHQQNGVPPFGSGVVPAGDIEAPQDALAWHAFPSAPDVGMRRHRRIDLWREGGVVCVDAFFRDACWEPDGSQSCLHEYTTDAKIDAGDHTLVSLESTPRVLPFPECKWAAPNSQDLIGLPVTEFRTIVQQTLTELRACTHLNDMLRSFAEIPALAKRL